MVGENTHGSCPNGAGSLTRESDINQRITKNECRVITVTNMQANKWYNEITE